jgi:hypothetical protein
MSSVQKALPGGITPQLLDSPIRPFKAELCNQAGLTRWPGSIPMTIIENLDTNHIQTWLNQRREINGIDLQPAWIARGRSPLHTLSIEREKIAAIGRKPSKKPTRELGTKKCLPKQDKCVG